MGDTVKVSVDAEDSESGIKSVTLGTTCLLRRRSNYVRLTYNESVQKYEGSMQITEKTESGLWEIRHIYYYRLCGK